MNVRPTQVKDNTGKVVPAQEAVCEICDGNSFHIVIIQGHNHLICANPACQESYCQGGCGEPAESYEGSEHPKENCPYCGSGLSDEKGNCQKCGL